MDAIFVLFTELPYLLIWAISLGMGLAYKIDLRIDGNQFDIAHELIVSVMQILVIMTCCITFVLVGADFLHRPVWEIIAMLIIANLVTIAFPMQYYLQVRADQIRGASFPLSFVPVSNPQDYYEKRNGTNWHREPQMADRQMIGHPPPDSPWYDSMKKLVRKI